MVLKLFSAAIFEKKNQEKGALSDFDFLIFWFTFGLNFKNSIHFDDALCLPQKFF